MKKNLKIVSAAAAALLAVAPVVATGVQANAADIPFNSSSTAINLNLGTVNANTVNVSTDAHATGAYQPAYSLGNPHGDKVASTISGTINLSVNGKSVSADFENNEVADVFEVVVNHGVKTYNQVHPDSHGRYWLNANKTYVARLHNVYLSVGSGYTNTQNPGKIDVQATDGTLLNTNNAAGHPETAVSYLNGNRALSVSPTGEVVIPWVTSKEFKATDVLNKDNVSFYEKSTGNQVTSGSVDINANNKKLNVTDVLNAINNKYAAETISSDNGVNKNLNVKTTRDEIAQQLNKAGIKVASNGDFTVPDNGEFTVNVVSDAASNGKTASMTVTVNVPNVKSTHVDEYAHTTRVWNKKASYIYNEHHVRQGSNIMYKIGSGHNVVADANGQPRVYNVGGIQAYKLSDGYYKGRYVDVRNFSTSRVHVSNHKRANVRSRVFDVRGKAVKHMYIEKGATVRIYGTKTIKGHKMYKIAKHNRYVKVANF